MSQCPWLYRFEAGGIQSYILSTDRLQEIRGASQLIEDLQQLFLDSYAAVAGQKPSDPVHQFSRGVLFSAAGGATAVFADEASARDFLAHWPMVVELVAPGLAISQALVPWESSDKESLDRLSIELAASRQARATVVPQGCPVTQQAPRSGLPAVPAEMPGSHIPRGKLDSLIDQPTLFRLSMSYKIGDKEPQARKIWGDGPWENGFQPPPFLENLEETDAEKPLEFLACIHADGNDIGRIVHEITTQAGLEAMADFSKKLTASFHESIRDTLIAMIRERGRECFHNQKFAGRPVVVGGDDLTMIIRSDLAVPFLKDFLERFQEYTSWIDDFKVDLKCLTATAGVAFVGTHYPFRLALDLATNLCDFAKEKTRGAQPGQTPSSLIFHRIISSISDDYQTIRSRDLYGGDVGEARHVLAMGPYLINSSAGDGHPTLESLLRLKDAMANPGIPSSGIREIIQLCKDDLGRVDQKLARMTDVLGSARSESTSGDWESLLAELGRFGSPPGQNSVWFADPNSNPGDRATPLLDAYILHQFEKKRKVARDAHA